DGRCGERAFETADEVGQAAAAELPHHGLTIRRAILGPDVDQCRLDLLGVGVPKFEARKMLQVIVQQPGMIDRGLQDQSLAARDDGTMAAMDGARDKLRARDHVRFTRAWSKWRIAGCT